jgi:hypothetical protein
LARRDEAEIRVAVALPFPVAWVARGASVAPVAWAHRVASVAPVAWAHLAASEHREPLQAAPLMPRAAYLLALREQSLDRQAKEDAWAVEQPRIPAQLALRALGRSRARLDAQHQAPRMVERQVSTEPLPERQ